MNSTRAVPALRKDESFNSVEAILQGRYFASPEGVDQTSDWHAPPGTQNKEEAAATTTQLGMKAAELLANIDVSAVCSSGSTVLDPLAISESVYPTKQPQKTDSSIRSQQPQARCMLQAHNSPASHTALALSQPFRGTPPTFAIIRPYMSSQSVSSEMLSSATAGHANVKSAIESGTLPQSHHAGGDKEPRAVVHADITQEPTTSSASEVASSWTAINKATPQRPICSSNTSRQTSRGTSTYENVDNGSFFEAEMEGMQRLFQHDPEDDLLHSTATGYSDHSVSQRD